MRILLGLVSLVVVAGVLTVGYALAARFVVHGPVTPAGLHDAVARESGSASSILGGSPSCRRLRASRTWSCVVFDASGSGAVEYRVRVRPASSCFDGRITGNFGEGGTQSRIGGCVYRARWKLLDLL